MITTIALALVGFVMGWYGLMLALALWNHYNEIKKWRKLHEELKTRH